MKSIDSADFEDFLRGYIEAALWADCMPPDDDPDGESGGRQGLEMRSSGEAIMRAECEAFVRANQADLTSYCAQVETIDDSPSAYAGHDFWLTSHHHGAGFWDRKGVGRAVGARLTESSHAIGREFAQPWDCGDGTADYE
jgi:hypothetical protein